MKLTTEEITKMLSNSIADAISSESVGDEDRMVKIEKSVAATNEQIKVLANLIATGGEKPPTPEEVAKNAVTEALKPITETLENLNKKVNGESEPEPIPQTKEDLQKMISDSIKDAMKSVTKKGKPKGEGSEDSMDLEDGEDGDTDLLDEVNKELSEGSDDDFINTFNKEETDAAGNTLTEKKIKERKALDDYFGGVMGSSSVAKEMTNDEDSDEDED